MIKSGYQKGIPGYSDDIRNIGGLTLRLGRFLFISQIYTFAIHELDRDSLKNKVGAEEEEILRDLFFEWNKIQEIAEIGEEDLLILVY